jgi:hypothetical protein
MTAYRRLFLAVECLKVAGPGRCERTADVDPDPRRPCQVVPLKNAVPSRLIFYDPVRARIVVR